VIRKMQGAHQLHRRRMQVRLGEDMTKPEPLETYARAVLRETAGDLPCATSSGDQGSSMLNSLTRADCLVVLPVGVAAFPAGTVVEAIPLR
jgi:molybdopterin biosynthesis enzyme